MSYITSEIPDKIIVDRRKSYRNSDVRNAVRRTRVRLAEQGISDIGFNSDLLALYARSVTTGTIALILMIALIAAAAVFLGLGANMIIWGAITIIAYVAMSLMTRHFLSLKAKARYPRRWAGAFVGGHFALGGCWAWFSFVQCLGCNSTDILFFKAMAIIIAMASTVMISHNLQWSLIASFAPTVVLFAIVNQALIAGRSTVVAGGLLLALLFFELIATRLRRASLASMSFRSENRSLVAELEMARSISEEARRRAEDSNLAKSRFLASMSHELRTPLNAILGFSEVMANEVLGPMENENYRSYSRDIHQSGTHLLKLINEILDLSRIEAGKHDLNEEPLDLPHVIDECVGLVTLKADQKNVRIEHVYEKEMPRLFADERSIRQVALNLLSNSVKFTPSGGKILVKTGWTATGGQYLSVSDNGPGIPEDEIPVVLSAFGQGSVTIKSAEQGTGLGLPIVQALMAMHGGTLKLKSKLRQGTEAIATFPAERVMDVLPATMVDEVIAKPASMPPANAQRELATTG